MSLAQLKPEGVEERLRQLAGDLGVRAKRSNEAGARIRKELVITPQMHPLEVTIGFRPEVGGPEENPEMAVTIEPELWGMITSMWEHNSESDEEIRVRQKAEEASRRAEG